MVRTYLYVPADKPALFAKAAASGADAIILDLEDGVAPSQKNTARTALAGLAPQIADSSAGVVARIEPSTAELDIAAALDAGVSGFVVPKATERSIDEFAKHLERIRPQDLDAPGFDITALIESGRGIADAQAIAAHERVARIALGEADLCADLAITISPGSPELAYARGAVVVACAAAGIAPPTAGVFTDISDPETLRVTSTQLKAMGFGSRSAIHPSQIGIIADVFAPSEAELGAARAIVDAFDASVADGRGVTIDADGKMLDEAVVRSARRLLG